MAASGKAVRIQKVAELLRKGPSALPHSTGQCGLAKAPLCWGENLLLETMA